MNANAGTFFTLPSQDMSTRLSLCMQAMVLLSKCTAAARIFGMSCPHRDSWILLLSHQRFLAWWWSSDLRHCLCAVRALVSVQMTPGLRERMEVRRYSMLVEG